MGDDELRTKRETLGVALLLVLGSILIIYPFMDAIVLAVAAAYLLSILHKSLNRNIDSEILSNVIIISGLLGFISTGLYLFLSNIFEIIDRLDVFTTSAEEIILSFLQPLDLPTYVTGSISDFFDQASDFGTDILLNVFTSMPNFIIHVGIFLVTTIYLYKDRRRIYAEIEEAIDNLPKTESKIAKSIVESIDSIFKGVFITQVLVAAIMGVLAAIGFYIIGTITTPIPLVPIWALLIAMAAILPLVAAFMFYAPLASYYVITSQPLKGAMIFTYGIIVLQILPEIFFRPWVGSRRLDEHPLIIFIGFLAGPLVLGVKGIILGPLMLILTKQFILNYTDLVSEQE